ncbi:uncharacterized protein LOC110118989 [Ceratitis capitata]|uniref:(Mediterranean fruit fly) hypothetical protein n=1 Tax=Ceratitis capitata TaxID=7213 RepID=W8C910_CERCA|nr:uncharacterized protein LOC110118989 [Ceratitis capitata]CAD7014828.1 unnamed protein product [Ceratitis capitata]
MSKNYVSKEEAINHLYATIKSKFEEDGVLQEVRCMLQTKMVAMMKGKSDGQTTLLGRPLPDLGKLSAGSSTRPTEESDNRQDPRLKIMQHLIMEYFHWHGFHYTAEMFAQESGTENLRPSRQQLERAVGPFEHKSLPILLELVAELMEKNSS